MFAKIVGDCIVASFQIHIMIYVKPTSDENDPPLPANKSTKYHLRVFRVIFFVKNLF